MKQAVASFRPLARSLLIARSFRTKRVKIYNHLFAISSVQAWNPRYFDTLLKGIEIFGLIFNVDMFSVFRIWNKERLYCHRMYSSYYTADS